MPVKLRRAKVKKNKKILKRGLTRPWEMARKKKLKKKASAPVRAVRGIKTGVRKLKSKVQKAQVKRLAKKQAKKRIKAYAKKQKAGVRNLYRKKKPRTRDTDV
jgi:predicted RecB family endonuclease